MVNQPQRPFTVDASTHASNPGNLHIDYFYWIRSFPSEPIELIFPQAYIHPHCGGATTMPEEIIRSYLVNPLPYEFQHYL